METPTTQLLSQTWELESHVQPHAPKITSIKALVESSGDDLSSVPSEYTYTINPNEEEADPNHPEFSLPVIDLSILTSGSPDQRSKIIHHDLVKICEQWGFFILVNHGIPESLMTAMIDACHRFFNLPENEKQEFHGEKFQYYSASSANSTNVPENKAHFWRDYFKVQVHPEFFSPDKPTGFSEILLDYTKRTREVVWEITKVISESLGLEANYIHNAMNMDRGSQLLAVNYYPPCPKPEHAIGLPNHTDYGLLTLLIDNGTSGLQVEHNGKWLNVNRPSNAFFVNLSDQLQMLTNNKYKSVLHKATLNNRAARISIVTAHGPSLDTVVKPAPELLEREGEAPKYLAMSYKDCIQLKVLSGKLPYVEG